MRIVEARVFLRNQLANMRHTLGRGWLGGQLPTLAWRALRAVARMSPGLPMTAFAA